MNANACDSTYVAATERRARRRPRTRSKLLKFPSLSFETASAHLALADFVSDELQGYCPSVDHSSLSGTNVWSLVSADDEWIGDVWLDHNGKYHVARDLDPETGSPVERAQ